MAKIDTKTQDVVYQIQKWLGVNENPDGDTKLKMGEAAVMQNFRITDDGSLQVRPGSKNIAGLMNAYSVEVGDTPEQLAYDSISPTTAFRLRPSVSVSDMGLLSSSGEEVEVNYSNYTSHIGKYYEDNVGRFWKLHNVVYDDGKVGGVQQYRWSKWNCTSSTWYNSYYSLSFSHVGTNPGTSITGNSSYSFNSSTGKYSVAGNTITTSNGTVYVGNGYASISNGSVSYYYAEVSGPHYTSGTSYSKGSNFLGYVTGVYGAYPNGSSAVVDGTRYWYDSRVALNGYSWEFLPVTAGFHSYDHVVRGIWSGYVAGVEYIVAACNGHLWSLTIDEETGLWSKTDIGTLDTSKRVSFFGFNEKLYMLNGIEYKVWDGTTYGDVQGYRPIVAISSPPAGGGTLLEQVNKLTAAKRQWFSPAGSTTTYQLSEEDIASVDWIKENGTLVDSSEYTVNIANGTVSFTTAPTDGTNTIEVAWTGKHNDRAAVLAMTCAELYNGTTDNRIFLYGDGSNLTLYSGLEHKTGLGTAEYFPDLNVMHVGDANTPVTSLVRHYNRLMAFKEDSAYSIYYDAITLEGGTVTAGFYVTTVNRGIGNSAIGQVTLVENHPRSLDGRSIYEWKATYTGGIVTGDQRNAKRISQRIENTLSRFNLKDSIAYFDKINHEYYLAYDRKMVVQNTETDAWYVYENLPATAIIVYKDEVYIGTDDGYIRHLSRDYTHDNGENIACYWESGSMDFGAPHLLKSSKRLWIGVKPEANGQIRVTAITDKDTQLNEEVAEGATRTADWETSASGFFSFLNLDFTTLSFNVNSMPRIDAHKIKAKKFVYYKLIFSSSSASTTATVTNAEISVRYAGNVR